ncbi:PPOX class F420-dependent oxidoreductase [Streptomyces sp. NPDC020096]
MTTEEWRTFVSTGTRTGKLAVTRADGRPHVTPVWFLLDDASENPEVLFTTWGASVKAKALLRDPRFSLCVDDQQPPYSYVRLDCTATLTEDPTQLLHWATRLGHRYMGGSQAETFGKRNAVPGEYLVRGRVDRVVAQRGIADF